MTTQQILKQIEQKDFPAFIKEWAALKDKLTRKDKQKLLIEILDDLYSEDDFEFYVKVFDEIIDSKVSLDFNLFWVNFPAACGAYCFCFLGLIPRPLAAG